MKRGLMEFARPVMDWHHTAVPLLNSVPDELKSVESMIKTLAVFAVLIGIIMSISYLQNIAIVLSVVIPVAGFVLALIRVYIRLERLEWTVGLHGEGLKKLESVPETLASIKTLMGEITQRLDRHQAGEKP